MRKRVLDRRAASLRPRVRSSKAADLVGPGISTYEDVDKILPADYRPLLPPRERAKCLHAAKRFVEDNLCRMLNLIMVPVPLVHGSPVAANGVLYVTTMKNLYAVEAPAR